MSFILKIDGMMCSHCTGRVQSALESVQGVTLVQVSLDNKQAQVNCAKTVGAEVLKDTVEKQGYKVLEVTQL